MPKALWRLFSIAFGLVWAFLVLSTLITGRIPTQRPQLTTSPIIRYPKEESLPLSRAALGSSHAASVKKLTRVSVSSSEVSTSHTTEEEAGTSKSLATETLTYKYSSYKILEIGSTNASKTAVSSNAVKNSKSKSTPSSESLGVNAKTTKAYRALKRNFTTKTSKSTSKSETSQSVKLLKTNVSKSESKATSTKMSKSTTTTFLNSSEILQVEKEMSQRTSLLAKSCKVSPVKRSNETDPGWEYLISEKHKLIWCNVFKSASSSWFRVFNRLAGYSESDLRRKNKPAVALARAVYPRPSEADLRKAMSVPGYQTFLVARNPFERLVSAYREKIVGAYSNSPHHKLGKKIVSQFRPTRTGFLDTDRPTFSEFVSYLISEHDSGNKLDMHWTPAGEFCSVCRVLNFTSIVKFETMSRDQRYILGRIGIPEELGHWNKARDGRQDTKEMMEGYMAQLGEKQFAELCEIYEQDFKAFGYSSGGKCDWEKDE